MEAPTGALYVTMKRKTHLCAGDAYLRTGVDVDAAVRFPADGAAHCVGDANDQGAALLAVPQRHQGVSSLT